MRAAREDGLAVRGSDPSRGPAAQAPRGFIGRPLYPMRLLGTIMFSAVAAGYVVHFETTRLWYLVVLLFGLVSPHVALYIASQRERRRALELRRR